METLPPLLEHILLAALLPLWLLAGWADAKCHRHLHIEHTAGLRESLLHLAMLAEISIGLFAALLLELNAAALVVIAAACVLHEITVWIDLAYAESTRGIPWFEQWLHGLQQALPWVGLVALILLSPAQALALIGLGEATPDWQLRWKSAPVPLAYLVGISVAAVVLVIIPFLNETRRSWQARKVRESPLPTIPPHEFLAPHPQGADSADGPALTWPSSPKSLLKTPPH